MKDLPNLDLIRAMAVLSVVLEHLLLALRVFTIGRIQVAWIGVVGVFVFFIHTSLVLMWSMERRPHVLDFYLRRIFRIYPLAIVAVLAVLLFHAPVAGTPMDFFQQAPRDLRTLVANLTLMQNLLFKSSVEGVLWSLPLEVQMYVLLPALFFYVRHNFAQWPLFVLFGLAVLLNLRPMPSPNLLSCSPYFLSGVIAYVGFGRRRPTLPAWLLPVFIVVTGAIFLLRPGFRVATVFCLVVGAALPSFRQIRLESLKRLSHIVAKYSYGIYISHPFGLVLGIYLMPRSPLTLQILVALGTTALFSVAAYHFIELPMIKLGSRVAAAAETRYEQRELAHYRGAGVP